MRGFPLATAGGAPFVKKLAVPRNIRKQLWKILREFFRFNTCKFGQRIGSEYLRALSGSSLTPLELGV